ncbi:MAG: ArsB/NhaD family transporter [Acidaminococcaceae bacterium]|nr:ArsB/NhaD family transporter [Acidaminococcaceae bacterium]
MDNTIAFYEAVIIFAVTYIGIIFDKIPRTICALVGGGMMIYFHHVTQDMAIKEFIDFNTLGLLAGMMVLISIVKQSGFFEAMALWAVKKSRGKAKTLLILLSAITGIGAALIDSVTAALLIAPMTISICRMIKINPMPVLISEVLMSNIGGTALMIGNPPNVMIGSAAKLEFMQFLVNLAPVVIATMACTIAVILLVYRGSLHSRELTEEELQAIHIRSAIRDLSGMKKSLTVLLLTVIGFVVHSSFGLQSATIAMSGAILAIIVCGIDPEEALKEIDMNTLLFFMGLFILVGGLETAGVIKAMAEKGIALVDGDVKTMTFVILFLSGIASAFVDNIPFTAIMIPLIQDMQNLMGIQADYLWWSLSLGACFGGNGTLIGASPNVIIMAEAARSGYDISFTRFMKACFPIMLLSLLISGVYLYLRYFFS